MCTVIQGRSMSSLRGIFLLLALASFSGVFCFRTVPTRVSSARLGAMRVQSRLETARIITMKSSIASPPEVMQAKQGDSDQEMKLGVLLLNLGGPETMNDVEGFLFNLFADPDIIRLPPFVAFLQKPLAFFIAKRKSASIVDCL